MQGKGRYYWSGDKNTPGPVCPPGVLQAIYNFDKANKKLNLSEVFKTTLLELCKGSPSELERSVEYFEIHCHRERLRDTSFCFDNDFINSFIKTVGDRCEKDEKILRNADGHI